MRRVGKPDRVPFEISWGAFTPGLMEVYKQRTGSTLDPAEYFDFDVRLVNLDPTPSQRPVYLAADGTFTVNANGTPGRTPAEKGDALYLTESPDGYRLTVCDPSFEQQMEAARKVMKKRRNVLREFGVQSVPDLLTRSGDLWHYALEQWCRLCLPNQDDQTRSRWLTHPFWVATAGTGDFGAVAGLGLA